MNILMKSKTASYFDSHERLFNRPYNYYNTRITKGLALLAASIVFSSCALAADTASDYESPPAFSASDVLTAGLLSSENHRVLDEIHYAGQYFQFDLETDQGLETVISRALLKIRIHEAAAVADALRTMHQAAMAIKSNRSVNSKLSGNLSDQSELSRGELDTKPGYSQIRLSGKSKKKPAVMPGDTGHVGTTPSINSRKRLIAAKLQMDVYSSNPAAQDILDKLAQAETGGGMFTGTRFVMERDPETKLSRGEIDAEVRRQLKDRTPDELNHLNDEILNGLGVSLKTRQQFLKHSVFTPRHKTYISAYLKQLTNIKDLQTFFDVSLKADNEVKAIFFEQLARMLSVYNEQVETLASFSLSQSMLVAYTTSNVQVFARPVDIIYWSESSRSLAMTTDNSVEKTGLRGKELVVTGILTNKARDRFAKLGFTIRDNFLTKNSKPLPGMK